MIKKITMIGVMVLSTSCLSTGRDFSSNIDWVQKNKTKQVNVSQQLGRPFSIGNSGGVPTWTYAYYTYKLFGATHHKELKIYWDADRQVQHYSFTSSFPKDIQSSTLSSKNNSLPAAESEEMPRY